MRKADAPAPAEAMLELKVDGKPVSLPAQDLTQERVGSSAPLPGRPTAIEVLTPLEQIGDLWPILRALSEWQERGDTLEVHFGAPGYGVRLHRQLVETLLRLARYVPEARRPGECRLVRGVRINRPTQPLSCSVIVPCRNEVDNIAPLIERLPALGSATELIFVDGNSTDGTVERIQEEIDRHPEQNIRLLRQQGNRGKADATFEGFDAASGDVVMILDADMTVRPEDLPRFYLALAEGVARFSNGTRLVYPMEAGAMPPANLWGNRAFCLFLSWVTGAPITDSLCGTKALLRSDWQRLRSIRHLFGDHDPWGDFDLLLGAAYLGLNVVDVPVVYAAREAGESKMRPFAHGLDLARTCAAGVRHVKFGGTSAV